jgi:hypothetical protein
MGGESGLWEDEQNPKPEPLGDKGKQESMGEGWNRLSLLPDPIHFECKWNIVFKRESLGAKDRALDAGIPNQNHRKQMAEQSREEESENLRPRYAGPPPSSFRAGDIIGPRCLSSLDEGSPALSALHIPSPPTEFSLTLQSSWRMTC